MNSRLPTIKRDKAVAGLFHFFYRDPPPSSFTFMMVFGLFENKEAKLQQERLLQEKLISEQLQALQLEHELQRQTMIQKGLINRQQQQLKNEEKTATAAGVTTGSTETTHNTKPNNKLAQHMELARKGYEQLVHAIIRPPRATYKTSHLGPASFSFLGTNFTRDDTTLLTERGYRIECSHWRPPQTTSVVVYMHGNASARVEVFQQLSYLLALGTSVFAFDFAGSGLSEGDYVSLGYFEREDLATVIAHLRATLGSQIPICLWGRSMGAATALMYASREATMPIQNVKCLILDSSFCDLVQLAEEMVDKAREQGIGVPNVVVSVALAAIGWSVQAKAKFDIKDISPIQHAPHISVPALVVCGEQDDFIKPHHSERICEKYKGSKNLLLVQGDHNDVRPPILFQAATQFLSKHLLPEEGSGLSVPDGLDLQTAPWHYRHDPQIYHPLLTTQSSTVSTIDATEMGMTKERQHAIQASLQTMLGQEDVEVGLEDSI